MSKTGVFYHPSFSRRSYLTIGVRLSEFPEAFSQVNSPDVIFYESKKVDEKLLLKVHSREMIDMVKEHSLCSTAWHSAGGVVEAAEKIWSGEIENAFVYIGAGGHHAGRHNFWGYCCFNDVVLAIVNLREKFGVKKFAILDTDAHHGDGTRELLEDDRRVLHVCLCGSSRVSWDETKVDVEVHWGMSDREYAELVKREFVPRVEKFKPELIFWYFGHDTHEGDYGEIGLTVDCYFDIADVVKKLAERVCNGRLEVVLGGGSRTDVVTISSLEIIKKLAGLKEKDQA